MQASFGNYSYSSIAGYLIQAGLMPRAGIQLQFSVFVILASRIDVTLPDLPSRDEALAGSKSVSHDLSISKGSSIDYTFPKIQFRSIRTLYDNSSQYHVLEFFYPLGLTRGKGKEPPAINLKNTENPTLLADSSKSRGTVAVNGKNTDEAQLVAMQAYQIQERACGLQMVSERCQRAGWLDKILDQNKKLNGAEINDCDLAFALNGEVYSCLPNKHGMKYLFLEERYGLALDMPLHAIDVLSEFDAPPVGKPVSWPSLSGLVAGFTARNALSAWGASADPDASDKAVEICSVVSETAAARLFDWRSPRQKEK